MAGLLTAHPVPQRTDDAFELNGWRALVGDGEVRVDAAGSDRSDGLRVVVSAAWAWRDDDDDAREPARVATGVLSVQDEE
jgi:hypothetical protein